MSSVDVPSVPDANDQDQQSVVLDAVQDAKVADADAPDIVRAAPRNMAASTWGSNASRSTR
jgi:hypothetical protein